jgi:putative restriction endonuclease
VVDELRELAVREALFKHLDDLLLVSIDETLRWDQTETFAFNGESFSIRQARGRGISKPAALDGALSITTAFTPFGREPPYEDLQGDDGYPRYKYEGANLDAYTNRALRLCMDYGLPIVYFIGVRRGVYKPIYPMFVVGDDPRHFEFILWFSRIEFVDSASVPVAPDKRYVLRETRSRLHQPIFREQVLNAYAAACAVCSLKHTQLLDAAHIIGDSRPNGDPVVPNGIALCKIHHAAYDQNFLGIRPDYKIVINPELLGEVDGPMLKHGLQEMHGSQIHLPRRHVAYPDQERLSVRFEEFKSAS